MAINHPLRCHRGMNDLRNFKANLANYCKINKNNSPRKPIQRDDHKAEGRPLFTVSLPCPCVPAEPN